MAVQHSSNRDNLQRTLRQKHCDSLAGADARALQQFTYCLNLLPELVIAESLTVRLNQRRCVRAGISVVRDGAESLHNDKSASIVLPFHLVLKTIV